MGNIYHSWNGTVLTVTSDSGTSSCDLKGAPGDMGIRGPQGLPGILVDTNGVILGTTKDIQDTFSTIDKRITNLEEREPEYFMTDASVDYMKGAPAKALPFAEIEKVGGMTYKEDGALTDTKVTEIHSVGANLFNIANIHETAAIDGSSFTPAVYAYNQDFFTNTVGASASVPMEYIDKLIYLEAGNYTFSWESDASDSRVSICTINPNDGTVENQFFDKVSGSVITLTEAALVTLRRGTNVEVTYTNFQINRGNTILPYESYQVEVDLLPIPIEVQALEGYGQGNPDNPDEYNYINWNTQEFVTYGHIENGVWEAYEQMKTIDISNLLPNDNFIEVRAGGSIIAVNENNKPVPFTITYQLKGGNA